MCQFVTRSDDAAYLARDLLAHLPRHGRAATHVQPRPTAPGVDPGPNVPATPRRVYDVRDVIATLVDGGELLEVSTGWARNMVCGSAGSTAAPSA